MSEPYIQDDYIDMLEAIRASLQANGDKIYLTDSQWEDFCNMTRGFTAHQTYAEFTAISRPAVKSCTD